MKKYGILCHASSVPVGGMGMVSLAYKDMEVFWGMYCRISESLACVAKKATFRKKGLSRGRVTRNRRASASFFSVMCFR